MRLIFLLVPLYLLTSLATKAADADDIAGQVIADLAGTPYALPLLDSAINVDIQGDMATIEVTQRFVNEAHLPLQAEYLFPLNQNAAVYGMEMRIGDEIIQAQIREKHVAEAEFKQATDDGKAAALLTQHRPNMFTQRIANLMPGLPIEVTLRYVQMVPKIDGQHELVIPLIVGPRYQGSVAQDPPETNEEEPTLTANTWNVSDQPAYPLVAGLNLPETFTEERVSLDLKLTGGVSLSDFGSESHPLTIAQEDGVLTATFADGKVLDNRDLIIRFSLGGETFEAAGLSHTDERGGFLSLMIEPPALAEISPATPRELVFVLDTSGSMGGLPMRASKRFMDAALSGLGPDDYFRIIPFANSTQSFAKASTPATVTNIRAARSFVNKLNAGGGTDINNAIRTAFGTAQPANTLRIVVFLSDGYIGNEALILKTIRQKLGSARIYAFGIGNSVNRYLLDSMADEGRGYARYVGVDEDAVEVAETLAADLKTPLLTDITIDWGNLDVTGVSPSRVPDLFAGNSLRVYARHDGTEKTNITIKGIVQGREATLPVELTMTESADAAALPLIWARTRIAALTRQIAVGDDPDRANKEITELGLDFSLQTRNTSFIAVSQTVVNANGPKANSASVPLPKVSGVPAGAYSNKFAGSSAPEPHAIFSFIVIAAMTFAGMRRRAWT